MPQTDSQALANRHIWLRLQRRDADVQLRQAPAARWSEGPQECRRVDLGAPFFLVNTIIFMLCIRLYNLYAYNLINIICLSFGFHAGRHACSRRDARLRGVLAGGESGVDALLALLAARAAFICVSCLSLRRRPSNTAVGDVPIMRRPQRIAMMSRRASLKLPVITTWCAWSFAARVPRS